jgi:hypothetical protein
MLPRPDIAVETAPRFRIGTLADIPRLQAFVAEHWKAGHVFVREDRLLRWQHLDASGRLNFVLADDPASGELFGLLGFIPTAQYDPALAAERDYWLALWRAREDAAVPGLGMGLQFFAMRELQPNVVAAIGIKPEAFPIYQAMRYSTGKLAQFYYLNPGISNFNIARVAAAPAMRSEDEVGIEIARMDQAALSSLPSTLANAFSLRPKKSPVYFINRYIKHPVYDYEIYGVRRGETLVGCWVLRTIERPEGKVLRGVDCIFDPAGSVEWMRPSIARLVRAKGAEYWDCLSAGVLADMLARAGFALREGEEIVLPNYFEPFVRRNIDILYGVQVPRGTAYSIAKGDSDQDRPS